MAYSKGIRLKKKYGQHFLRNQDVVDSMLNAVELTKQTSIFEIGPGDGFLTTSILQRPIAHLWAFEIDEEWANYLKKKINDTRFTIYQQNFLDFDFTLLQKHKPWTVLSNLPYQITF